MIHGYTILEDRHHARVWSILFAGVTALLLAGMQIADVIGGGEYALRYTLVYVSPFLMILAAHLRSYLLFLMAAAFFSLRLLLHAVLLSLRPEAYTSFEILDLFVIFVLLSLSASLVWQAILFFTGHADHVALTHTSLLFVIISLILIFFPHIIHLFLKDLYVTDTWDAVTLSLSFLSFANGIEKLPKESTPTRTDEENEKGDPTLP